MEFAVRAEPEGGFFSVLDPGGEVVAICTTERAAADLADAMRQSCEEAIREAVAFLRLKHGAAIVEPR